MNTVKKFNECRTGILATVYEQLSILKNCEALIKKHLPPRIAAQCHVNSVHNNIMTIMANNSGTLSLLRYEKPELLRKLRTEENMYGLKSIELKLTEAHLRAATASPIPNTLHCTEKSSHAIHQAAEQCTYSPLKSALERLEKTIGNIKKF